MFKASNARENNFFTQLSAEHRDLMDIMAEIIAFDILKETENSTEEDTR